MKKTIKTKLTKLNSNNQFNIVMKLMNDTVDEKLKNIKVYTPILSAVITSIIAFLFASNVELSPKTTIIFMVALGFLLIAFVQIIVSFFGRTYYKPTIKKIKMEFTPHIFHSYCYLSDENFCKHIKSYIKKDLTEKEILEINFLKQKINECVYRRQWLNSALGILEAGTVILIIICFISPFVLQ